jgi:hypothetical protein
LMGLGHTILVHTMFMFMSMVWDCLWTEATSGPVVHTSGDMSTESHGGILTGETEELREKTCPSATLSIANSTWTDLGFCGEMPGTNRMTRGTA